MRYRILAEAGNKSVAGLGVPLALVLLLPMEAGIPIPIPADLVMLLIGERSAQGDFPLWAAVLALELVAIAGSAALFLAVRGPGRALVERAGPRVGLTHERIERARALVQRRGRPALAIGRGTPGLRTVTVVAAGGSGIPLRRALPALALGASVFLQLHLVLGYILGPAAQDAINGARGPALVVLSVIVLTAAAYWFARRRRRAAGQALTEAACPACLAINWVAERHLDG